MNLCEWGKKLLECVRQCKRSRRVCEENRGRDNEQHYSQHYHHGVDYSLKIDVNEPYLKQQRVARHPEDVYDRREYDNIEKRLD